jgi:hypothetical protein
MDLTMPVENFDAAKKRAAAGQRQKNGVTKALQCGK